MVQLERLKQTVREKFKLLSTGLNLRKVRKVLRSTSVSTSRVKKRSVSKERTKQRPTSPITMLVSPKRRQRLYREQRSQDGKQKPKSRRHNTPLNKSVSKPRRLSAKRLPKRRLRLLQRLRLRETAAPHKVKQMPSSPFVVQRLKESQRFSMPRRWDTKNLSRRVEETPRLQPPC